VSDPSIGTPGALGTSLSPLQQQQHVRPLCSSKANVVQPLYAARTGRAAAPLRAGADLAHVRSAPPAPSPLDCSLKVEELINAVSIGFLGLQFLLGALSAVRFAGAARVA
jgi:hypothetical protein